MPVNQADRILEFLKNLHLDIKMPKGVVAMNPYRNPETFELCTQFFKKYYNDSDERTLMLGINPGRFGSGMTGISFTDPVKLEQVLGINNSFAKKAELSADFIYKMIEAFGGPTEFYQRYFISAVSPLGFTKDGNNINYYDIPRLQKMVTPFVVECISQLMQTGMSRKVCYCIGEGKNLKYLVDLNDKHKWFDSIVGLPHPRFIMQYRRKKVDEYIRLYLEKLGTI